LVLFALDKIAGSPSLAVSLPTMLVAFGPLEPRPKLSGPSQEHPIRPRYGRRLSGITGGLLLGIVPSSVLVPTLAALLLLSSVMV
jgi:uncharacterized protein